MKTILCPVDFSKSSLQAVAFAADIGKKYKSRIILLHAYELPLLYTEVSFTVIQDVEKEVKALAQKKLDALRIKLSKSNTEISVEAILIQGGHKQIAERANLLNVDMIVMGTTGTTKFERLLMGSTTAGVIRLANCPVLCVPKEAEFNGINKIVFATDLHEDNLQAAMSITAFAKHFNAEIVFVFVDDKHLIHSDEKIDEMTIKIRKRVKYPKISGYISKSTGVTKGLEHFLKKFPAELLVMFTHERHFPGSLFNQSITKMVSHQAKIPLLILKNSVKTIVGAD